MDRYRRWFRILPAIFAAGLALVAAPVTAWAFDHVEITVVNPQIVQGRPTATVEVGFSVRVRAVNTDGSTDTNADFINAELFSPDVPASLPARQYLQGGERQFDNVVFHAAGRPVRLRVRDFDDASVPPAEVAIDCYNYVRQFSLSVPGGDKFVDQPVATTITALDQNGDLVLNFRDDVLLDALVGDLGAGPTMTVSGLGFALGQVTVPVVFWGTDPVTRENTLTATNTRVYPGQPAAAAGSVVVSPLRPGPLATVVLILPGETHTPGVSPGKSGTPLPQVSGNAFGGVNVYATDQHWNPVESAPFPTLSWSTDDGSPGVVLPANGPMAGNASLANSATLILAGLRRVTVTGSGPIAASSESNVVVNPEGLHHFVFDYAVWDTTDIQVTTIPFQLRVRAEDINDNPFPFNGQVTMRVRIGAADESEDYLLTNNSTFVNGQLNALVQVTKRAFIARLLIDSNAGVVGTSGAFQVNAGPLHRILLTFPGETWVPGLNNANFSGNLGVPNSVTAGQTIFPVTVRPVDRYANIVPGLRNVTLSCPTGYFQLPDYPNNLISLNNPVDVRVILRTYQNQVLQAEASGVAPNLSSHVQVSPAQYGRMAVEAPGEQLAPGIFDSIELDGKLGQPSVQDAGVAFRVRVFATDNFWNPVQDVDPVLPLSFDFSSSDLAAVMPVNPQSMNDNTAEFLVTLRTLADPNQQTIRVDHNASAVFAFTTVPLKAGVIDHFDIGINNRANPTPADALLPIPDHQAGSWLPNVTIIARDIFDNHIADYQDSVTIYVNHGTGVLTPTRVSFADGFGSGNYRGCWRGPIRITKAGTGVRLFAREEVFAQTDSSNTFTVFPGPYSDLVLLLDGETHTPGIAPGKVGTPRPTVAGDPVLAHVIATDAWWNPVTSQPSAHFESSSFFQMVSANNQPLQPNGTRDFDLFFKTATLQRLAVRDLIQPALNDTSAILVGPASFARLMILAPGEAPQPGGPEADGKIGTPNPQTASLEFDLRVRSVDQFWNQVDDSSEHIHLASDDNSLTPTNPLNNDQQLVTGEIIFPVFLINTGYVTLAASALDHTDLTGQAVTINVQQGAVYQIATPDSAYVGPPSSFPMSITLLDSLGQPLVAANNWVTLTAFKSNLEPAGGVLQVTQAQLNSGQVTLAAQAYDTVEDIVIRISDTSGRASYSNPIHMLPNGLEYVVTVQTAPAPRVGPPATFPVSVRLRDAQTHTLIDDDRDFTVTVMSALGGVGAGAAGTTVQRLDHGQMTFQQSYTKAENVFLQVQDTSGLTGSSPVFAIGHDGYKKLQIVAPGEVIESGNPLFAVTGKSGVPTNQRSGEPFPLTVRAVDQYWNLADDAGAGRLHLVASDNSFALPGNPTVNDVPFVNGRRTFTGFLTDQGTIDVAVYDLDDTAKPSQTVGVPVDPPYEYEITVPASAPTGPVPGFQVTVKLVDPTSGNVVPTAQNRVTLTPLKPNRAVAGGLLGTTQAQLIGGVAVINNQSYSTVEDIIIRVSDDFGREAFSSVIQMQTGGLYYAVDLPDSAVVGGPSTFLVGVELMDANTGQRVTTQDRLFDIQVFSASTGQPGLGVLGVRQGLLAQGLRTIAQTYTKAEDIFIQISDTTGVIGISNTCRVLPDGFKRIQVVAPGETVAAGAITGSGKSGTPLTQQAEVPFTITVRAVDQYFNLVDTVDDGRIVLSSSGGTLDLVNPIDVDAPFINGSRDFEIVIGAPGVVAVFANDATRANLGTGRVDIPINEAEYRIVLPDPPVVTAGPPASFSVTVRLVNPETGLRINAGNAFTMQAYRPDRSPAMSQLGVTAGTLVAGEAVIGGQTYGTSEPIVVRVTDSRGRLAYSEVLTVVPVGVRFQVDAPDTVRVGQTWTVDVRRIDVTTQQLVTNDDRGFRLRVFDQFSSPRPIPLAQWNPPVDGPRGCLDVTCPDYLPAATASGVAAMVVSYDRAETIYLAVTDTLTGEDAFSTNVVVLPGGAAQLALQVYDQTADPTTSPPLATPLRSGGRARLAARATDAAGNAVPGLAVVFEVVDGDGTLGDAGARSLVAFADSRGLAQLFVRVDPHGARDILLRARTDALASNEVLVDVIGPPITTVSFTPVASPFSGGYYIAADTRIQLAATTEDAGGIQAIYFDVDVTDPPVPAQVYGGEFTLAQLGLTQPGVHTLRFFAEERSLVREAVRTVQLYTGVPMATDRPITNRPNPFHAGEEPTVILFTAQQSGTVSLTIRDLYGGVVYDRQLDVQGGELAQFVWDGRNGVGEVVANGGYICRVFGAGLDLRRKIAVIK